MDNFSFDQQDILELNLLLDHRKTRHWEGAKRLQPRGSCSPPTGLHSHVACNCTDLYTKNLAQRRRGHPGSSEDAEPAAGGLSEGLRLRDWFAKWRAQLVRSVSGLCVLISLTVSYLSVLFVLISTAHLMQLLKSAGFYRLVGICRGAGVWQTGNAWDLMRNSFQRLSVFCPHHLPEAP